MKTDLPVSSCWIVVEELAGLRNQAIGLAQALGVTFELKEIKKPKGLRQMLFPDKLDLSPPWPDLLISCGRRSVGASVAVRRASKKKTFTVHIQDPFIDPRQFDIVIAPAHDNLSGNNVLVTQGSVHHVNRERLISAAEHFRTLFASLPRPLISVLVGGKNKHQEFTDASARDFAGKLCSAAANTSGALAITTSRRTGVEYENILRQSLAGIPSYFWDGQGENPYLGLLALADVIVVTGDSVSMVSEACSTGKPVYIFQLPNAGKRHKQFCDSLIQAGRARPFSGTVEVWKSAPLEETQRAADFVFDRYMGERRDNNNANVNSGKST